MKQLITGYEKISSFLHGQEVWAAKLECGHEVHLAERPEDGKKYLDCEECDE
jgi:hypothetical protein